MSTMHITHARVYRGRGMWEDGGVFVREGVIIEVGPDDRIEGLRDPDTVVVDAQGASVVPGFHDTHVHPSLGGLALLELDLHPVHDAHAYVRMVADYARAHPEKSVVRGSGWYGDAFPGGLPTRALLDAVIDDRPVVLESHDSHGVWVNSAALAAAGVDDDVVDPRGGVFVRDDAGRLTGVLLDAAVEAVSSLRADPEPEQVEQAILAAQARLHSVGVTTWHDAAVGESDLGPDTFEAYLALDERGEILSHVRLCQWWDRHADHAQIDRLTARRDRASRSSHLDASIVKIMQDGVIENHTGALLEPYGDRPGFVGESFIPPQELCRIVALLDGSGFDIHLHAVGDRAVRECLDAIGYARQQNGETGGRHQIAHLDVVDPTDAVRFAQLGVAANVQMLWARSDAEIVDRKLPALGPTRARHHFPFRTLHAAGARLVAGSDWPVSDPNPLWAAYVAVHRLAPPTDPHATGDSLTAPLLAEEAIPLSVAFDAYAWDAAWAGRLEDRTGRLAAGFSADLVLLDRDVSTGEGLAEASVVATWIGGVRMH